MTTQYTTILKLALPVQGELSGTWGDVVNDNITSMVEEAVAGRKVIDTWTANSHTLTSADGTTSESRAAILTLTDTGTALTGAGTVVCPALSKIYIVENSTAQVITIKTSGGTGIAVPVGRNMVVFCDGTNVEEGISNIASLSIGGDGATVTGIKDEDDMSSDSATKLATQQSIKAYVDSQVGANNELSEVLANGNTTGGTDISVSSGDDITFADNSKAIFGAGSDLEIFSDGTNGRISLNSASGNLRMLADEFQLANTGYTNFYLTTTAADAVLLYHGGDQKFETTSTGIDITGNATFDDNGKAIFGAGSDLQIYHDGTNSFISDQGTGHLKLLAGDFRLNNAADDAQFISAVNGAEVNLYHNGSAKLATTATGIDVTGRAVVDGLTSSASIISTSNSNSLGGTTFTSAISTVGLSSSGAITSTSNSNSLGGTSFTSSIDVTGTVVSDGLTVDGGVTTSVNLGSIAAGSSSNVFINKGFDSAGKLDFASGGTPFSAFRINVDSQEAVSFDWNYDNAVGVDRDIKFTADGSRNLLNLNSNGDISFYEDTGTTAKLTWDSSAESLNFADNSKAIFGAGSDLQIYHDGSHSRIVENGTGNLFIYGEDISLFNNTAESYLTAISNGAVTLFYDNASKLATTSFGVDITGRLVTTSHIDAPDNARIRLGDGDDLQIYHDGSASYIDDAGTGNLRIRANSSLSIQKYTGETMGVFTADGSVLLAHDNATKFETTSTGIDVTGTVTADGLTVDGNGSLLTFDNGSNPATISNTNGNITTDFDTTNAGRNYTIQANSINAFRIANGGDISFYNSAGTSQSLFWDSSAESLGIGTTSVTAGRTLETKGGRVRFDNTVDAYHIDLAVNGNTYAYIGSDTDNHLVFYNGSGTERMRIDSSGNVGIGTSSPSSYNAGGNRLVVGSGSGFQGMTIASGNAQSGNIYFADGTTGDETYRGHITYDHSDDHMHFKTAGSEAMRIDSSGNLLVGKTSTTLATSGAEIRADGFIRSTVSNATCMQVNRTTGTGTAIDLRYAGTSVGSIVVGASSTTYNTSSDQRLKENIVDAPSASDDIDAIQVRSFDWKADGSHQKYGMVAQELQSVVPEAVSGDADSDDMMGVDYSKLVPMLVKEIQSLRARVAQLEGE